MKKTNKIRIVLFLFVTVLVSGCAIEENGFDKEYLENKQICEREGGEVYDEYGGCIINGIYINSRIYRELENNEEVEVMVQIKDDLDLYSEISNIPKEEIEVEQRILYKGNLEYANQYSSILMDWNEEELLNSGFKIKSKGSFYPSFSGNLTKEVLNHLLLNDNVSAIGYNFPLDEYET